MHRCPECEAACICGGDVAEVLNELPNPKCIHCAPCCDHSVSFDDHCPQCDEEIHGTDDSISTGEERAPAAGTCPTPSGCRAFGCDGRRGDKCNRSDCPGDNERPL